MRKRVVSFLLALTMTAGLLSGCGGGGNGSAENGDGKADTPETKGNSGEVADMDEKELTTVRILCKNDYSPDVKTEDWESYPVSEILIADLEEIGIRLELECIDNESFENVVSTRMASGVDLPDLISYCWVGANDQQDIMDWAKSGLVYSANELLETYDTDGSVRAFYDDKAPGAWEMNADADGTAYWFTYFGSGQERIDKETGLEYVKANPTMLSIRQDWVEAVGEEKQEVYTPEEFFSILKKMRDEDANGNGQQDEVVHLSISGFGNGISKAWGLTDKLLGGFFQADNRVFSNFYHENFPAYIEFMKSLYENDLYDTVSLTSTTEQMTSENRAAAVNGYSEWDFEYSLPGVEEDKTYYSPILLDTDGDLTNGFAVTIDSTDVVTYCQYFVPKGCENPEAVTRLMDYIYTERYALLNEIGIEGKAYEFDVNNNIVKISGTSDDVKSLSAVGIGLYGLPRLIIFPEVTERYDASRPKYVQEKMIWNYRFHTELYPMADKVEFGAANLAMATDEEAAFISEKTAVLQTYAEELLTDLILGNKSITDLAEYQAELEELGLTEYLNIMQARRNRITGEN